MIEIVLYYHAGLEKQYEFEGLQHAESRGYGQLCQGAAGAAGEYRGCLRYENC